MPTSTLNPLIYISNESSYAVEERCSLRGKKMLVQIYTCRASHKLLISVSGMPTRGIFPNY